MRQDLFAKGKLAVRVVLDGAKPAMLPVELGYDPLADFVPVAPLAAYTLSMTVGPGTPAEVKTVADFIAWAKANPNLRRWRLAWSRATIRRSSATAA